MDESQVKGAMPRRHMVHKEYKIRIYQQEGKDAKEDGGCEKCFKHL
jgi:hypothetical protein